MNGKDRLLAIANFAYFKEDEARLLTNHAIFLPDKSNSGTVYHYKKDRAGHRY